MNPSTATTSSIEAQAHEQLVRQLSGLWTCPPEEADRLAACCGPVLGRVDACIGAYKQARPFSCLHAGNWCIFLQYLRQELGPGELSEKLYLLSRALHAVDFYSATLPGQVYFEHPVGSVIGRAQLGERLVVLQNITIGGSRTRGALAYPVIGDDVIFYAYSAAIGNVTIGAGCILATGTRVVNESVPAGSLVFGASPHLTVKPLSVERFRELSPFRDA